MVWIQAPVYDAAEMEDFDDGSSATVYVHAKVGVGVGMARVGVWF